MGEAGPGTLAPEVAERLVNGIINGTYPDVRAILAYHKGALRLEEYFYGYDRDRPHQVISESWMDAVVAKQSHVDDSDYGLGMWHRWYNVSTAHGTRRVDTIMLSGNGGQKVYIVPSLDLVVVFTGGAFNVESPVTTVMARVLLPAMMDAAVTVRPPAGGD